MSEKFSAGGVNRKIEDGGTAFISFLPIALLILGTAIITLLINAAIGGAILKWCWDTSLTKMFGLPKIRVFQALVLFFTIACLKSGLDTNATKAKIKEEILKKGENETIAEKVSEIFAAVYMLILILIAIEAIIYAWNNVIPELVNYELCKVNFIEACACAILFYMLFGASMINIQIQIGSYEKKTEENAKVEGKEEIEDELIE